MAPAPRSLTLLLALGLGSPFGCKNRERRGPDAAARASTRPIRVPLVSPIRTLDPAEAQDPASQTVIVHLYERLYRLGPKGEPIPELAAALPTVDSAGTLIRIPLASGHAFRPSPGSTCVGRSVSGKDVLASLTRLLDPAMPNAPLLHGRLVAQSPLELERDGAEETLILHLAHPQPELAQVLASAGTSVLPRDCPGLADKPAGSGPYLLAKGSELPRSAALSPISAEGQPLAFEHIPNAQTALSMFRAGELDVYAPAQDQFGQVFEGRALREGAVPAGTTIFRVPVAQTNLLLFAQTDPGDSALREAVCWAFDGDRYAQALRNGGAWADRAEGVVPTSLASGRRPRAQACNGTRDLDKARSALTRAALTAPVELHYATATGTVAKREADLLRASLAKVGIALEIHQSDTYLYDLAVGESRADLFALGLSADYPNPRAILQAFTCAGELAPFGHYCNPAFDQRLTAAYSQGGADAETVRELEAMLLADHVGRVIDHPQVWYLVAPGISGIERPTAGPLSLHGATRTPL